MVLHKWERYSYQVVIFLCAIFPTTYSQRVTVIPSVDEPLCPGVGVTFTCETRGSPIIAWTSDQYIEVGGTQLEFGAIASVGDVVRSPVYSDTVATLTVNGMIDGEQVLESTLHIVTSSQFPTSSVTCIHIGTRTSDIRMLQVMVDPDTPDVIPILTMYTMENCVLDLIVSSPSNTALDDVKHFMTYIDGRNTRNITVNETMTSVNQNWIVDTSYETACDSRNFSIRAVNRCGYAGQNTPNTRLYPRALPDSSCRCNGSNTSSIMDATSITCLVTATVVPSVLLFLVLMIFIIIISAKRIKKCLNACCSSIKHSSPCNRKKVFPLINSDNNEPQKIRGKIGN